MPPTKKHFRKRDAILSYLKETKTHPSAEMVFAHLKPEIPDLSLGTVYRNLSVFKEQGQIISLGSVNGVERFDGNTVPHVHFICTCCSSVTDLPALSLPESLSQAATEQTGGRIDTCHLSFTGCCSQCLSLQKGGESA